MKFILVILLTMGTSDEEPKTIEIRIPLKNLEECLKSAKTFKFSLPIPVVTLSSETRCEPRMKYEEPKIQEIKI